MTDVSLRPLQTYPLQSRPLPVGAVGRVGVGWWGLLCFILTEACLFGYLLFSYAYIAVQLDGTEGLAARLPLTYAAPMTVIVVASSAVLLWAERAVKHGRRGELTLAFLIALVLSIAFVVFEIVEWRSEHFSLTSDALGSAFFVTTGLHLAHFVVGIIALAFMSLWSGLGYFDQTRNTHVLITVDYWHFVNAAWVVLFCALYVVPYLG